MLTILLCQLQLATSVTWQSQQRSMLHRTIAAVQRSTEGNSTFFALDTWLDKGNLASDGHSFAIDSQSHTGAAGEGHDLGLMGLAPASSSAPGNPLDDLRHALEGYHVDELAALDPPRYRYIAYGRSPNTDSNCDRFARASERLPSDQGYWPGIDGSGGEYLFGTVWGQEAIWQHQHPQDCRSVSIALVKSFPAGIGSMVDIMGHVMSVAFRAGHVVMWHPDDSAAWWGPWCGETRTLDCYFEPLTNCTVENSGLDVSSAPVISMQDPATVAIALEGAKKTSPLSEMEALLECSPIDEHVKCHWFKNQAAAYLVRPNQKVLTELASRQESLLHFEPPGAADNAFRTVSVHIRWSEAKRNEADLVPPEQMWQGATALQQVDPRLTRLFVSTESSEAIEQAKRLQGWNATFLDVDRASGDRYEQVKHGEIRPDEEMLNSLLNLQLALESDAFVCNRYSNWCGLIDSLRLTAGRKADRPLLDNGAAAKFCNGDYSSMLCGLCPKCPW